MIETPTPERTEDVFDTRRSALRIVPPIACGHRVGGWVCIAHRHPRSPHHYYVKEARA